ncbi:MAG TPA: hypothetical protein VHP58_03135 [Alphaproteobacteria bacterium]|nr:hypothetical protein [Alphaproteobacteria bacterium]
MRNLFSTTLLALSLTACGYTPLYAPMAGGAASAHKVQVGTVEMGGSKLLPGERRPAQRIAQKLRLDFPDQAATLDLLDVNIHEQTATLAVEKTATTSRAEIIMQATLTLTNPEGKVLLRTQVSASSAYNVEESPYSTEASKNFSRLTAADNIAAEISRRIALYYAHPIAAPTPAELAPEQSKKHKP